MNQQQKENENTTEFENQHQSSEYSITSVKKSPIKWIDLSVFTASYSKKRDFFSRLNVRLETTIPIVSIYAFVLLLQVFVCKLVFTMAIVNCWTTRLLGYLVFRIDEFGLLMRFTINFLMYTYHLLAHTFIRFDLVHFY